MDTWEEAVEYDAMDFMEIPPLPNSIELGPSSLPGFWMLVLVQLGSVLLCQMRHRKALQNPDPIMTWVSAST